MEKIHFVGIGGVGTGTLAVALAEKGYPVSGSDGALYDPMKTVLANAKCRLMEGFLEGHTQTVKPDVVIIGNVVRKDNPEAAAWIRSGVPFISFPEAVRRYVIGSRKSTVCAGTHGKTTTSSWTSFLYRELGWNPSFLIGGVPVDLPSGCAVTDGDYFVGEGDEYDSAFFDKGPKFLHYNPQTLILANIEFDHADIYRDLAHVQSAFEKLIALLPGDGFCIAKHDDKVVRAVVEKAICPVETFGTTPGASWLIKNVKPEPEALCFELEHQRKSLGVFRTPLFGEHNLLNLTSGIAAAVHYGASIEKVRTAVEGFHGAKRRQQVLFAKPVTLVDDFAHHPTEVAATLSAVRQRFANGRLWAFFEPRSATARRGSHQALYPGAFQDADKILICTPYKAGELPADQRFSGDGLVESLRKQGKDARCLETVDEMVQVFKQEHRDGDVAVVMSNGEFGKIQQKLKTALQA